MATDPDLKRELEAIVAARDRDDMGLTIAALLEVLERHPDDPLVLYEVGGAYDSGDQPELAASHYEKALALGLGGETLRRCYLQYGSTLKNLGRLAESLSVFAKARQQFPDSDSLIVFEALTLHAAGRSGYALGSVLQLVADRAHSDEIRRYERSIRAYATDIAEADPPLTFGQ